MAKLSRHRPDLQTRLQSYFISHLRVLVGSLGRLYQFPGPSAMTVAVIAIALALPAGFYVLLKNAQQLSGGWDGAVKLSLYLHTDTPPAQAQALADKLKRHPQVAKLRFISREQSLQEFRANSGFGEALDALQSNPLPAVITISPVLDQQNPLAAQQLKAALAEHAEVAIAQLDTQWVKRLMGIIHIIQRGLLVLASMLGLAVVLVIGNTIRLDIQNRAREIRVQKLIGATNAFIRRPFLYTGIWYGLLGGLLAWLLVSIGLSLLGGPTRRLAGLYQSDFQLHYLDAGAGLLILLISVALGYVGSWLAVGRHLREIEPGQ